MRRASAIGATHATPESASTSSACLAGASLELQVDLVLDQPAINRTAELAAAAQEVEPHPVVHLASAAVHAVGEGQLVAGGFPPQGDVAAWTSRSGWFVFDNALTAQQIGEAGAHGRTIEGLDNAGITERVEEPIGQGEGPGDQIGHGSAFLFEQPAVPNTEPLALAGQREARFVIAAAVGGAGGGHRYTSV
jgi:hypothetical protein